MGGWRTRLGPTDQPAHPLRPCFDEARADGSTTVRVAPAASAQVVYEITAPSLVLNAQLAATSSPLTSSTSSLSITTILAFANDSTLM